MTALGRLSGTGYYATAVEVVSDADGYLATGRNLMDLTPGFTLGGTTLTCSGTASLRGRVGVNGLARMSVEADATDGLLELMMDMDYPAGVSSYSTFQMDMTGSAGLIPNILVPSQPLPYAGAARVVSSGFVKGRYYFGGLIAYGGTTRRIAVNIRRHSSPSQYVAEVGYGALGVGGVSGSELGIYAPLTNSGFDVWGFGFGLRDASSGVIREFSCTKILDTTIACPTLNCFTGNLCPLLNMTISGTTRALNLETGTVQDNWPGDGVYFLWQTSATTWMWSDVPGSNPFGGAPAALRVSITSNGSNWDLSIASGPNPRFNKINFAGGQDGMGGSLTTSATAFQIATDGGGTCDIGTGA